MGTLRFLLALCVVVTHAPGSKIFGHSLLNGITAVQGFYVISGFLITMVLNTRAEYRDVSQFYLSRYLRLWPAYAVVALLTLVILKGSAFVSAFDKLDALGLLFIIVTKPHDILPRSLPVPGHQPGWVSLSDVSLRNRARPTVERLDACPSDVERRNRTDVLRHSSFHLPIADQACRAACVWPCSPPCDRSLVPA